jgi:DNA-binding CsgD family transcriptional regulator
MEAKKTNCLTMALQATDGAAALGDLLQLLGMAAILVDRDGQVVGLNDAARECLGGGLHIRHRRLITANPAAQRALMRLIEGGRHGGDTYACSDEQVVVARRNARPLILRTIRLDGGADSPFHPASAIVVVLDAGRVSLPTESQLESAFGLSCGEARLAILLAAGEMLENAASRCGISYETARKRVKILFEKTDTRRQSELVGLVIRVGTLAGAVRAVSRETMQPRPRPRMIDGRSPAFHHQLQDIQTPSRSDRWKQFSIA